MANGDTEQVTGLFGTTFEPTFRGLLGDPVFNLGLGLLSAGLSQPRNLGQALAQGLRLGTSLQGQQEQNRLTRERMQREAQEAKARQQFAEAIKQRGQRPQLASATPDMVGATPGLLGPVGDNQLLGLLAQFDPGAAVSLITSQSQPTTLEREFNFLISQGVSPERALESLRRGTTVNVGDGTRPTRVLSPQETNTLGFAPGTVVTAEVVGPNGEIDAGTLDVQQSGRQPSAAEEKRATDISVSLNTLDRFANVVRENNIQPGFINEGGIAELLATPAGQVASEVAGRFGVEMEITPAQAEALSLQETLSNQLLAAMRGASVGPEEQAKFERQLPQLGQDDELFWANVRNTRKNLEMLNERMSSDGTSPGADSPAPTRRGPTVQEIGQMSLEQLNALDVGRLSARAKRAVQERIREFRSQSNVIDFNDLPE